MVQVISVNLIKLCDQGKIANQIDGPYTADVNNIESLNMIWFIMFSVCIYVQSCFYARFDPMSPGPQCSPLPRGSGDEHIHVFINYTRGR